MARRLYKTCLPPGASCQRVPLYAFLALYSTTPNELTLTINLLVLFPCLSFQIARVTQRSAFAYADVITTAGPSHHSRRARGGISHTVVWGSVEIN